MENTCTGLIKENMLLGKDFRIILSFNHSSKHQDLLSLHCLWPLAGRVSNESMGDLVSFELGFGQNAFLPEDDGSI